MKKILYALVALTLAQPVAAQKEISGVKPAKTINVGNQELIYNGAGLREKFFLDLYVGALYVTTKSNDPNQLINSNESMAITLDIVSGLISSDKMISAVNEGFEASTKGNTTPLKSEIQTFKDAFKEEIVKGDHFVIAYLKSSGTEVYKNGKKLKTIKGLEFKKALFGIWLCDDPADEDLKEGMLGLD